MPDTEERTVAACRTCGSAYAARKRSDGTIQPIGRTGCQCGAAEFRAVEDASPPDPREENVH